VKEPLIFIASNIIIYVANIPSIAPELQESCKTILIAGAMREIKLITDCFVLEEIFYTCQKRGYRKEGEKILDKIQDFVDIIFPIDLEDIYTMKKIFRDSPDRKTPEAGDFLHAAVMINHNLKTICSYDRDFDRIKEIKRIDPIDLAEQLKK